MPVGEVEYWRRGAKTWEITARVYEEREHKRLAVGQSGYLSVGIPFTVRDVLSFPRIIIESPPPPSGLNGTVFIAFGPADAARYLINATKKLEPEGLKLLWMSYSPLSGFSDWGLEVSKRKEAEAERNADVRLSLSIEAYRMARKLKFLPEIELPIVTETPLDAATSGDRIPSEQRAPAPEPNLSTSTSVDPGPGSGLEFPNLDWLTRLSLPDWALPVGIAALSGVALIALWPEATAVRRATRERSPNG